MGQPKYKIHSVVKGYMGDRWSTKVAPTGNWRLVRDNNECAMEVEVKWIGWSLVNQHPTLVQRLCGTPVMIDQAVPMVKWCNEDEIIFGPDITHHNSCTI